MSQLTTLKGEVIAAIVKGNPAGRLKAIEWGNYGEVRRVEWYDDPPVVDASESPTDTPGGQAA